MWLLGESCDLYASHVTTARTLLPQPWVSHTWAVLQMYPWGTPCTIVRAFILSAHYICIMCSHILCLQQSNLNWKGETWTFLVIYYTLIVSCLCSCLLEWSRLDHSTPGMLHWAPWGGQGCHGNRNGPENHWQCEYYMCKPVIFTSVHPYIHTYMHACIHTYIHT